MQECKYCGKPVLALVGRRSREYCNNACKQAAYRKTHQQTTISADNQARWQEECLVLSARIADLEAENMRLLSKLDVERHYLQDHEQRSFKAWLKKQPAQQTGELGSKLLSEDYLPARASRALYVAWLRTHAYSDDEMMAFVELWKLMLLS